MGKGALDAATHQIGINKLGYFLVKFGAGWPVGTNNGLLASFKPNRHTKFNIVKKAGDEILVRVVPEPILPKFKAVP